MSDQERTAPSQQVPVKNNSPTMNEKGHKPCIQLTGVPTTMYSLTPRMSKQERTAPRWQVPIEPKIRVPGRGTL
jgi:hypothetical protein